MDRVVQVGNLVAVDRVVQVGNLVAVDRIVQVGNLVAVDRIVQVGNFVAVDRVVQVGSTLCFPLSRQQLSRYIEVDTYGACGASSCDPGCRQSLTKYRFYLALENAHCRDYHTEKFYNAFRREQIPVTDSDAHSAKMAPTGSYIQMSDFASLQDLAVYLKKVSS